MSKKQFADNNKRISKIKAKMEEHAKPIIVFAYFNTQAECRVALGTSNAEINKSIKRKGTTRGFRVIKGYNIDKAISLMMQLNELADK